MLGRRKATHQVNFQSRFAASEGGGIWVELFTRQNELQLSNLLLLLQAQVMSPAAHPFSPLTSTPGRCFPCSPCSAESWGKGDIAALSFWFLQDWRILGGEEKGQERQNESPWDCGANVEQNPGMDWRGKQMDVRVWAAVEPNFQIFLGEMEIITTIKHVNIWVGDYLDRTKRKIRKTETQNKNYPRICNISIQCSGDWFIFHLLRRGFFCHISCIIEPYKPVANENNLWSFNEKSKDLWMKQTNTKINIILKEFCKRLKRCNISLFQHS